MKNVANNSVAFTVKRCSLNKSAEIQRRLCIVFINQTKLHQTNPSVSNRLAYIVTENEIREKQSKAVAARELFIN